MQLILFLRAYWRDVLIVAFGVGLVYASLVAKFAIHERDLAKVRVGVLGEQLGRQNDAVKALELEARDAQVRHALALEEAKKGTATAKTEAKKIMQRPKPQPIDECDAARMLFDEVLNKRK